VTGCRLGTPAAATQGDITVRSTSFLQTQAILKALEFASAKGGFGSNAQLKKTAQSLLKTMRSNQSVSGRHQQLTNMLKKGATIEEMIKSTGASRRTIFRYLNHFEEAGINLDLSGGKYRLT
jgi:Fic family protein